MADNLAKKRLEEFLREAPQASREEILEFQKLVEQYFLGDITPDEFKARRLQMGTYGIRNTKDIHMMRIKIPQGKLNATQLACLADLAEPEANRLSDVTSCPGAETCQLGISASRGLAKVLEATFKDRGLSGSDIEDIRIKVSGCPNSCGQHHVADIGFFGGARKINERLVPHFQLLLGGLTEEGRAQFGQSR